jgi:hypothetical protein
MLPVLEQPGKRQRGQKVKEVFARCRPVGFGLGLGEGERRLTEARSSWKFCGGFQDQDRRPGFLMDFQIFLGFWCRRGFARTEIKSTTNVLTKSVSLGWWVVDKEFGELV